MNVAKCIAALALSVAAISAAADPFRLTVTHSGTVTSANGYDAEPGAAYTYSLSLDYDTDLVEFGLAETVGGTAVLSLLIDGVEFAPDQPFQRVEGYFMPNMAQTRLSLAVRMGNFPTNGTTLTSILWLPGESITSILLSPLNVTSTDQSGMLQSMWTQGGPSRSMLLLPDIMHVTVSAVPEPSVLAMALSGFALVGLMRRRKSLPPDQARPY